MGESGISLIPHRNVMHNRMHFYFDAGVLSLHKQRKDELDTKTLTVSGM
jgi:hypothetical protein